MSKHAHNLLGITLTRFLYEILDRMSFIMAYPILTIVLLLLLLLMQLLLWTHMGYEEITLCII